MLWFVPVKHDEIVGKLQLKTETGDYLYSIFINTYFFFTNEYN